MKPVKTRLSILTGLIVIFILLFAGCGKDGTSGKYYMTAKVNGVKWESATDQLAAGYQSFNTYFYATGATSDENEIISIQFLDFPGNTGTYSMGTGQYQFLCFYTIGNTTYYVFDDEADAIGTLTITTLTSKTVKGTFSFTGVTSDGSASMQVTEGKFNLPVISL